MEDKTSGSLRYRCMLCKAEFNRHHFENVYPPFKFLAEGTDDWACDDGSVARSFEVHECAGGGLGVAELVGAIKDV